MENRTTWEFEFETERVANAAREKQSYHAGRALWWGEELAKAERELREKGVTFKDQPITGGYRAQAVIDPTISARIEECRMKKENHDRMVADYEAYCRALGVSRETQPTIRLTVDDIHFFGL